MITIGRSMAGNRYSQRLYGQAWAGFGVDFNRWCGSRTSMQALREMVLTLRNEETA